LAAADSDNLFSLRDCTRGREKEIDRECYKDRVHFLFFFQDGKRKEVVLLDPLKKLIGNSLVLEIRYTRQPITDNHN